MSKQIDIAGYLFIGLGGIGLVTAFLLFAVALDYISPFVDPSIPVLPSSLGIGLAVMLVMLSVPAVVGGFGLLKRRLWGRTLVILLSMVNLINVPLGTLVGGYTLWVLLQEESRMEF